MRYRSLPLLVAALLAPIPAHAQFLSAAVGRIQTVAHWMTGIGGSLFVIGMVWFFVQATLGSPGGEGSGGLGGQWSGKAWRYLLGMCGGGFLMMMSGGLFSFLSSGS